MHHQFLALLCSRQSLSLAFSLLLMTGCAAINPDLQENPPPMTTPNAQSDFDELLAFGANMAKSSPTARNEICRSLLKRQKASPESELQLQLMVGRLLSDSCGDIPKILDSINAIAPELFSGERMRNMVSIQTEALKRLLPVSKKISTPVAERKQKTDKPGPESKDTTESKKNETDLLREKLEAIRSMEKHLDESGGAR